MKLRTVFLVLLAILAVGAILDFLGASLKIRPGAALGVVLLSATAWLLVRRAVRRDHDSTL
jgi:positive regulator of sigma E activity